MMENPRSKEEEDNLRCKRYFRLKKNKVTLQLKIEIFLE